jgi:hypothetical protein
MLVPKMEESCQHWITTSSHGLLVFQTSSLVGFYYNNGIIWDTFVGCMYS